MSKLLVTRLDGRIVSAVWDGNAVIQLSRSGDTSRSGDASNAGGTGSGNGSRAAVVGDIYLGRVKNLAKNIQAAFIEIGGGQVCYCNLEKGERVRPGEEFPVQVTREAVKTKDAVVSRRLSLPGKYVVLTENGGRVAVSGKITAKKRREALQELLRPLCQGEAGFILRTNSEEAGEEEICREAQRLRDRWQRLREQAPFRTCFSRLAAGEPDYLKLMQDLPARELEEIVTDQPDLFQEAASYLEENQPEDREKLRLYEDSLLPLPKLYSLETAWERALQKRVWLKSGGYLVIEPTEALTVIDVNTGKYDGRKNREETFFQINREAAREVAFQLRLRNLSGIILVDFIDMEAEEKREALLRELEECLRRDPIKTVLVDITKLNLVEITRKKIRRPLYEQ